MEQEHVHYVPGEDMQIAAFREMINVNRRLLSIDPRLTPSPDGSGELDRNPRTADQES